MQDFGPKSQKKLPNFVNPSAHSSSKIGHDLVTKWFKNWDYQKIVLKGMALKNHTGTFAQNSFQIDSINSCGTSKKLQYWLKIVKIIYFLTLKPIGLYLENNEKKY